MKYTFKKLNDDKSIDLVSYMQEKRAENSARGELKVYVGTDSQNSGGFTHYAIVIVLHYGNNGAHVIYSRERVPRIRDRFERLWREVEISIEVGTYLSEVVGMKPAFIDLDLNPDPKFNSNSVLRAAFGYVESMGFTPRCKPNAVSASYAADKFCKKRS